MVKLVIIIKVILFSLLFLDLSSCRQDIYKKFWTNLQNNFQMVSHKPVIIILEFNRKCLFR